MKIDTLLQVLALASGIAASPANLGELLHSKKASELPTTDSSASTSSRKPNVAKRGWHTVRALVRPIVLPGFDRDLTLNRVKIPPLWGPNKIKLDDLRRSEPTHAEVHTFFAGVADSYKGRAAKNYARTPSFSTYMGEDWRARYFQPAQVDMKHYSKLQEAHLAKAALATRLGAGKVNFPKELQTLRNSP